MSGNEKEAKARIKINKLLEFRRPYYERADVMINTEGKSPLKVAEEIIEKVKGIL